MHPGKKVLLHSLVVLSAVFLFLYITSRIIIVDSFAVLENQMMRDNVDRVLNSLANEQQEMLRTATDWAVWDDTYAFMGDGNSSYVRKNLLANSFSTLNLDIMAFVRPSGTILFCKRYLSASGTLAAPPDSLLPFLSPAGVFLNSRDPDKKSAGLIMLPEGPLLVASRTIVTSREEGPSRGIIVIGRFLDADAVKRLADTTRLALTIERFDAAAGPYGLPDRTAVSPSNPIGIRISRADSIAGIGLVKDLKGDPALIVHVEAPREIFLRGKETVRYFLAWIIVILLVFTGTGHLLFRKIMLSRESQRESEGRYRAVVEQASDAILLVDAGGKGLLETNPAFSRLFGYQEEECRRLTLYDIITGDTADCDRAIGKSLDSVNQPMQEVYGRRKNGMPMPMELAVSRIPFGRREVFCVILRDITERRRAEEAVRTKEVVEGSERRFRAMATHAPVGIFQTDVWGDCLFINETYSRLTGIGVKEAQGKGWLLSIHPEDRDRVVSAWFEAVRGGYEFSLEYRYLPVDGEEVRTCASAMPVRDEGGRISGFIGTITDISELKKREEELREQSSFLNAVIQRAAEGICVCRNIPDHPYIAFSVWNERMVEITGYSREEINRRGWYQSLYTDPQVRKRAVERMEAMRQGEDLHAEEWRIVRSDGQERVVLISTSILKSAGEEVQVLAIIQDKTERKRMEELIRSSVAP